MLYSLAAGVSALDAGYVVIGAGITGASIARHLAHYGVSVLILEALDAGGGATGSSVGVVRCYDRDPLIMRLASASLSAYADDRSWAGGVRPLRRAEAVTIASLDDLQSLEKGRRRLRRAAGLEARVIIGEESALGVRTAKGVALVEPGGGWIRPDEVTRDLITQARNDGATLIARRAPTRIPGARFARVWSGGGIKVAMAAGWETAELLMKSRSSKRPTELTRDS